jgi:glycogen debranching enzyme
VALPAPRDDGEPSQFTIESTTSFSERRPRSLKHGHTFGVFDRRGDILAGSSDGLYHRDTRFLSQLELAINGAEPLLLSSNVQDNGLLSVDLTNPDMIADGSIALRGQLIHVSRLKFVWKAACYEQLLVRNFDLVPHAVTLAIRFAADFADLFEVRGEKRARRGRSSAARRSPSSVVLRYLGLDEVERLTSLDFEPAPTLLDTERALFELSLSPGEEARIGLRVGCDDLPPDEKLTRPFYSAMRASRRSLRMSSARAASLDSSNSMFNELARRSVGDLYMLITGTEYGPYPFAGIPWFSTVFGRDGLITALLALWVDPEIARGVLRFLAATQATGFDPASDAEPGKILHEMRDGEMARLHEVPFERYYGTVDATPLFVLLVGEYFQRTGDLKTVRALWPNVKAALAWIDGPGDPDGDGFVEYGGKAGKGLVNQGWKDSHDAIFHADGRLAEGPIALCEVQGYVYAAKRHAAVLATALGRPKAAATLQAQAETLRANFEAAFWCEELSTYAMALDGAKRPCQVVSSNAGQVLMSGIADPQRAGRVARTLLAVPSFSGWGVRTVALSAARYNPMSYHNGSVWPHDNALIALGLARYGHKAGVLRIFEGLFDAAGHMDLRRLPELFCGFARRKLVAPTFYPVACSPQAWATATTFALVQAALGLGFDQGAREIRFDRPILPDFIDRLHLRGLRLRNGEADILIHRHDGEVSVTVTRREGEVRVLALH